MLDVHSGLFHSDRFLKIRDFRVDICDRRKDRSNCGIGILIYLESPFKMSSPYTDENRRILIVDDNLAIHEDCSF